MTEQTPPLQPTPKRRIPFKPLAIGLGLGAAMIGGMMVAVGHQTQAPSASGTALIGGPFTLVDGDGKAVTEKSWPGKHLLVFFGFTYCPDICPTELQAVSVALADLAKTDPAKAARVQPLFISVDPKRDTPDVMKAYVAQFGSGIVGLTGTQAQVDAAMKVYRVYARAQPPSTPGADDYLVDHSAILYLMSPDGRYLKHFGMGTPPEKILAGLKDALS
jgi:cytochrome oxidase Cu insertion factor (SCO1/SenC/PrrC family)